MKQPVRMEVLSLMGALILAVLIIGGYIYTSIIGHDNQMLLTMSLVVVSHYFGNVGNILQAITTKKSSSSNNNQGGNGQ